MFRGCLAFVDMAVSRDNLTILAFLAEPVLISGHDFTNFAGMAQFLEAIGFQDLEEVFLER